MLNGECVPGRLKFARAVECTEIEMRLGGQPRARSAGGPVPMEGGYGEGYTGGGFGDEPASPAPARARMPVNDLDEDIPF